jgi:MFS family permease
MQSPPATVLRTAWLVVVLLMPVALLNYLDRQMVASMQTSVMASIPSLGQAENREELWGYMLGQFKWVYAVFSLIGGYSADRFSRRLTICGSLIVLAVFGVGNAAALAVAVVFLIVFGLGWGFFDCNNMPIVAQIVRPQLRATGYGIMNFVSISFGGLANWGFGRSRDRQAPLDVIFGVFAGLAILSVMLVLLIRPRPDLAAQEQAR